MSMVLYYARMSLDQLKRLREEPSKLFTLSTEDFAGAEITHVDRLWEVLSWLVSPRKRMEHKLTLANHAAIMQSHFQAEKPNPDAFHAIEEKERAKLGVAEADLDRYPLDLPMVAIEGLGRDDQRDEKIDLGLGAARVFQPSEVVNLADALRSIGPADLRRSFDRDEMARLDVGGIAWDDEFEAAVDEFLIPAFQKLSAFYERAAVNQQCVIAVYS